MKALTPTAARLFNELDSHCQAIVVLTISGLWQATHPGQRAPATSVVMTPAQARAQRRLSAERRQIASETGGGR